MRYNIFVMNEKNGNFATIYRTVIVGGGAAGLFFAAKYGDNRTLILERGDRAGRKLSATGGGWGNVTNENAADFQYTRGYFTFEKAEEEKIRGAVSKHPPEELRRFLSSAGVLTFADGRGRVYPFSRQASAVTDALRREAARRGVKILTGEFVQSVRKARGAIEVRTQSGGNYLCENALICTGGKAAKNFGSDGNGYALAQSLGHTLTPVFPALVQLRCAEKDMRALKGVRVFDGEMLLFAGGKELSRERGDILFTDFGVSGDCAFKISSYLPCPCPESGCTLRVDFLPDVSAAELQTALEKKLNRYAEIPAGELLGGILNNRAGMVIAARAQEKFAVKNGGKEKRGENCAENFAKALAAEAKNFTATVTGTLGFDYAQVTKGGVKLSEVSRDMMSLKQKNVYFAGEILDADGACGGFNLQWAYSSACAAGDAITSEQ